MKEKKSKLSRIALLVFALAVVVVLFFSCISFNIGDFPSNYVWPNNDPVENWCGNVGAFAAYYLMYYFGPGIFALLPALAAAVIWKLCGKEISQIFLRLTGVILLTASVSSIVYMVNNYPAGSLPRSEERRVG